MKSSSTPQISTKSFDDFLEVIAATVGMKKSEPAFTLILGSGFSNGLVPTAWEMAMYDIPWFLRGDWDGQFGRAPRNNDEFDQIRRDLWLKIHAEQEKNNWDLVKFEIDDSGLPVDTPDNIAKCYQAIMRASSGLSSAEMRHDYLKTAVSRSRQEINSPTYIWQVFYKPSTPVHGKRNTRTTVPFAVRFSPPTSTPYCSGPCS